MSNPTNQDNPNVSGLLGYCIKHGHWSVFEQAHMTLEIETTRGLAAQILRHRSFTFQEFSQRYANTNFLGAIPVPDLRRQDEKNRQNSIDDVPQKQVEFLQKEIQASSLKDLTYTMNLYVRVLRKECARFVLPLATPTRLYMTGTLRSWIHYIDLRSGHGTQKEHMEIAEKCRDIFKEQFPIISEALEWN